MNLYNLIPALNGYKTIISGYGLLFVGLGGFLTAVGGCLQSLTLDQCYGDIASAWQPLVAAFIGLGILGVGHKVVKANQ